MAEKPRVIFLDDDLNVLDGYRRALREASAGWDVVFFTAPRDAIEEFRAHPSAVLVTDYFMPGQAGLDVLKLAKEIDSVARVIVVTGSIESGGTGILDLAKMMGATRTFMKPFQMAEMGRRSRRSSAEPSRFRPPWIEAAS